MAMFGAGDKKSLEWVPAILSPLSMGTGENCSDSRICWQFCTRRNCIVVGEYPRLECLDLHPDQDRSAKVQI